MRRERKKNKLLEPRLGVKVRLNLNSAAELEVQKGLIEVDPTLIEVRDCKH